jgi:hypothetical protein
MAWLDVAGGVERHSLNFLDSTMELIASQLLWLTPVHQGFRGMQ